MFIGGILAADVDFTGTLFLGIIYYATYKT